ncbi:MAG: sortase [Ornithinimicrobium sp.]
MTEHDQGNPGGPPSKGTPGRHRWAGTQSWPAMALGAGVCSLVLVLATLVGYELGSGAGGSPGDVTESAAAARQDPAVSPDSGEKTTPAPPVSDAPSPPSDDDAAIEAPRGRGMLHVEPISVAIPSIDVSSTLVELGLNADNSLEVPQDYSRAGWYEPGSYPGDSGGPPALIVGHVDNSEGPAVFYALDQLRKGDEILVTRTDGSTAVFIVYGAKQYPKDSLPTDKLYAERAGSEIVLITCSGDFDSEAGSYLDNYVVRAKLDRERSGLAA